MEKICHIFSNKLNMERNRAEGWQHAKLSGHKNEVAVMRLFDDKDFCEKFAKRLGTSEIVSATVGGLNEEDVACVLGGKTKSKTDLVLTLCDGKSVNISIKKSSAGQVYLISVDRFIEGYEKQYAVSIPNDIKDSLRLYFYGHKDVYNILNNANVTQGESATLIQYQKDKGRLVWKSLKNYDSQKAERFKEWIRNNIVNIIEFCFSRGLSKNKSDWADYVWYKNALGEHNFDYIYKIEDIKMAAQQNADKVFESNRNGGSTIRLPFGFVQWHQKQMQFHHQLKQLKKMFR